jgi:hypothetical protein
MEMSSMMPDVKEVLIPSAEIREKVREIGERITEDYREAAFDLHPARRFRYARGPRAFRGPAVRGGLHGHKLLRFRH